MLKITGGSIKKLAVLGVVIFQIAALVYMAGQREYIRAFGQKVYLQTAPIDPRDLFRGDYVRLSYSFSSLRLGDLKRPSDKPLQQNETVYAVLKATGGGRYELDHHTQTPPPDSLYLKGKTTYDYNLMRFADMGVKYGIEQYFVEQGQGLRMEERLGARGEMQVPMEVEVALGNDGTPVIRGYRWSQLGIQLEIQRFNVRDFDGSPRNPELPSSPLLKLSLQNVSNEALTLIDNEHHCSFHLLALSQRSFTSQGPSEEQSLSIPARDPCQNYVASPDDFIDLEPGAIYSVELDMSDPRWHVLSGDQLKEMGDLDGVAMFRIGYGVPGGSEERPRQVWQGSLMSQAFSGAGVID